MPSPRPFRPDINALRALAVTAVLLFHAKLPGLPGGFIGVDIFYVISGYLMMQIVSGKLATQNFSFKAFYLARARRIVPALCAVTFATLIFGWFALMPSEYLTLGKEATHALTFGSNFMYSRGEGYFAGNAAAQWLLHTWSLSLEWQFYLLFPLLLVLARRLKNGRYLTHILIGTFLLSLTLCMALTPFEQKASFYLLHTRGWELLAGALVVHLQSRLTPYRHQALAGLALLLATMLLLPTTAMWPGAWATLPVLGTVLIMHARPSSRLVSNRPTQIIGTLSYSLYLWHWPILGAAQYMYGTPTPLILATCLALTTLLAATSYTLIETPFRTHIFTRRQGLLAFLLFLAILAAAITVWKSNGLPGRTPASIRPQLEANAALLTEWAYPRTCDNYKRNPAKKPLGYCPLGNPAAPKVLFWGDSHMEHLYPALQTLAAQTSTTGILMATSAGCPPVLDVNRTERKYHCDAFNALVQQRAVQPDVSAVVLGAFWQTYLRQPGMLQHTSPTILPIPTEAATLTALHNGLVANIRHLQAAGKTVYLLQPVPSYDAPVSTVLAKRLWGWASTSLPLSQVSATSAMSAMVISAAAQTSATLLNPQSLLCPQGFPVCQTEQNGLSLYKDASHLSTHGAHRLLPLLSQPLQHP